MEDMRRNPLWLILVETAQTLPLYNSHKAYVRDKILPGKPDVTAEEISHRLDAPLGEVIVILDELRSTEA